MGALATHGTETQGFTVVEVPFLFTYKKMVDICDEQIVTRFGMFFDKWIIEFLKQAHNGSPGVALNSINKEFDDHREMLLSYLEKLERAQQHAPKYATISLEIEVEDLLTKIAALIGNQYDPKYEAQLNNGEGLMVEIPNIRDLIETVRATPLTATNIAQVAKLFRNADDLGEEDPARSVYEPVVAQLGDSIMDQLVKILEVALNSPDDSKFKALSENDIALLQSFVDEFKFLIVLPKMREIILKHLTGSPDVPDYNASFFTPEFFQALYEVPNNQYKDYFVFDEFIMSELKEPNLKKINTAAKRFFYDRVFPTLFATAFADLELDVPTEQKDHSPIATRKRHNAKIEQMAYIVFAFVRDAGVLPYQNSLTTQGMLKELFNWVSETPIFDPDTQPLTVSEGDLPLLTKPIPAQHSLISPHEFRKNYLPLLNWICHRIEGCTLFKDKKATIVGQFKKFGNTLHFELEEELKDSVPQEILDDIKAETVKSHVNDLGDSLTKVKTMRKRMQKRQPVFTQPPLEERDMLTSQEQELVQPPLDKEEVLPVQEDLTPEDNEKLEEESYKIFKEEVIEKVIAPGVNEPSKLKLDQINMILDAADSANDEVKEFVKKGFVKYLTAEIIRGPAEVEAYGDLTKRVTGHFIDEFRSRLDFAGSIGLRNFLMYNYRNLKLPTVTIEKMLPRDKFIFFSKIYDLIFFIDFAAEGYIEMLKQDPSKDPNDGSIRSLKVIRAKQDEYYKTLVRYRVNEKRPYDRMIEGFKQVMTTSPFLMARIHSFNLMISFVDFFEFFEALQTSNAQYLSYQSVFVNFYDFLLSLRYRTNQRQYKPFEYVLNELYGCLEFTERPEAFTADSHRKEVCSFSHRKYAEILYFYKLYLLKTNKRGSFDLAPYPGTEFDTHARMFLAFVNQNPVFDVVFQQRCKEQAAPICQASKIYTHLLKQLEDFSVIRLELSGEEFAQFHLDNPINKLIMVNGIETALLASGERGNVKDYEKQIARIEVYKDGSAFSLSDDDTAALTNYFKRTFRKAVFEPKEQNIARLIQGILNGPEDPEDPSKDTFKAYLVYDDVLILDFLKVFLLYAQTDAEYERIARVVIEQGMGAMVAKLNSPIHNELITEITSAVQYIKDDKVADVAIREKLHVQYAGIYARCSASLKHRLFATSDDPNQWEFLKDLIVTEEKSGQAVIQKEKENFENVVLNKIPARQTVEVVTHAFTIPVTDYKNDQEYENKILAPETRVLTKIGTPKKFQLQDQDFGDSDLPVKQTLTATGSIKDLYKNRVSKLLKGSPSGTIKTALITGEVERAVDENSLAVQVVRNVIQDVIQNADSIVQEEVTSPTKLLKQKIVLL